MRRRAGHPRRLGLVAVAMVGWVILAPVARAHTEAPAGFPEIVASAETIVRGHVTDVRGTPLPSEGIVSVVTIAVDETLKGTAGPFVSVIVPGGDVGRLRTVMPGAPRLRVNDAAIFLLRRGPDNVWRLAALGSGLYRLRREAETGRIVIDPPPVVGSTARAGTVDRGSAMRKPMTVPEFEALVRLVAIRRTQPIRSGRQ